MNVRHGAFVLGRLHRRNVDVLAAVLTICLLLSVLASASTAESYAIAWWTIDNGGATAPSTGGSFSLVGTIGQPDAGAMGGGGLLLTGGFWRSRATAAPRPIYLPLVLRQPS